MDRPFIVVIFILLLPIAATAQEPRFPLAEQGGYQHAASLARRGEDSVAVQRLRPLARGGDADAALLLGRMHAEGRGVPASREAGLAELRRAAVAAAPDALAYIGFRFLFEEPFPGYDPAEARRWFTAATQGGSAQGAFGLGLLHKHGRGVPQSDSAAAAWFRRAADGGFAPAELMLGTLHDNPSSPLFDPAAAEQAFAALRSGGREGLIWAWADAYNGGAREWYPVPVDHQEASRLRRRVIRVAGGTAEAAPQPGVQSERQP
jgi:TPR repeat protein